MDQKQELLMKASMLQQQSQEVEQNLSMITNQIKEMEEFGKSISALDKSSEKEMLASVGKGVYVKTSLSSKDLFVEVGSGVIVKKTTEEAKNLIESQVKKLIEARSQLQVQLEMFHKEFQTLLTEVEQVKNESK